MSVRIEPTSRGSRLEISGDMTVQCAAVLRDEIVAALPQRGDLDIDLAGVTEIDTAGLQLLLQMKRRTGGAVRFIDPSRAVLEVVEISRVAIGFDTQARASAGGEECP